MKDGTPNVDELIAGYDPSRAGERYEENKIVTKTKYSAGRRLGRPRGVKNGEGTPPPPMKKLMPRHYEMIALHLRGKPLSHIAETIGCTYTNVWRVLKDPLAKQVINEFYEVHKMDLMGLFPVAVEAVRTGLESGEVKTKLLAVDRFVKLKESTQEGEKDQTNVNITIVNDARAKLVGAIKEKIPTLTQQSDGTFETTE